MGAVRKCLPETFSFTADLDSNYQFPLHITPTDLRPDIVWWDDAEKELCLCELTVCFETSFQEAAERKETKYHDLMMAAEATGYSTTLMTLQVGSRGVPDLSRFNDLSHKLTIPRQHLSNLLLEVSKAAIAGSYRIWCARNRNIV